MKIVCISDTHGLHRKLTIPECDLLIHSGDVSHRGELDIILDYVKWADEQPAKHLILVPGNHEKAWEKNIARYKEEILKACPRMVILIEESAVIEGINIYGSPITPYFHNWAWNRGRGSVETLELDQRNGRITSCPPIKPHWDKIPSDTNILITHGPPYKIMDGVYYADQVTVRENVGCQDLSSRIAELPNLKLHVFGHIHADSGEKYFNGVHYINASICDEQYSATNPPRISEIV